MSSATSTPRVLLALLVLLVLRAAAAAAGTAGGACDRDDHCCQLELIARLVLANATANCSHPQHFYKRDTVFSVEGRSARVQLARAEGAAAAAARALLHALLRRVLGLAPAALRLADRPLHAFCDDQPVIQAQRHIMNVSVASAWRGESCAALPAALRGGRAQPLGAGAAPGARRLYAHAARAARAACLADWTALAEPSCGFLTITRDLGNAPPNHWPNCTCNDAGMACATVLVVEEGEGRERALLERLCARAARLPAPRLRLAALPRDAALRAALRHADTSFLFLDYDLWGDAPAGGRVRAAPPLPCAGAVGGDLDDTSTLLVADAGLLMQYAPRALSLVYRFRPPAAMLRGVLEDAGASGPEERAACRAAGAHAAALVDWFRFCEPARVVFVVPCVDHDFDESYHNQILEAVDLHWKHDIKGRPIDIRGFFEPKKIKSCDDTTEVNNMLKKYVNRWEWTWTAGVVVQGAAGAEAAARTAAEHGAPLLLAQAPPPPAGAGPRARAAAPSAPLLARALGSVLDHCGWRRVALLREGSRSEIWENLLSGDTRSLVPFEQDLDAQRPERALAALRAKDARVVVLDAGAAAARRALAAAARAPGAGPRAWLVLRAAGADWRPPPGFTYLSLSGAWRGGRGGRAAPAPGGSAALRGRLEAAAGARWSPLAAPLVDALLLLMTAIDRSLDEASQFYNDLHSVNFTELVYQKLDNVTVEGVTHTYGREPPFVFVHRWSADGGRLLGAWPAGAGGGGAGGELCGAVRDAPVCRTAAVGRDTFAPHCLDVPIAIALCVLALTPPALCAAVAARRARLRRRDRAVEERLLARSGPSAAAAAAAAALAGHAVPRAAVQLLDRRGRGYYGVVWLALLRAPGGAPQAVAAKMPRADGGADAEADLLREAALLEALRHEHVVRFVGVCLEGAPLLLMEHAFHGDLKGYLLARRPAAERARAGEPEPEAEHVAAPQLTRLAREAAAALGFLAHARLVHRDVRAANCLVDARRSLKLGDFGMARRTDEAGAAGEYLCRRRALFPVLWMAPEALAGVSSAASDVWALGVLLLELATLGARPFGSWPPLRALRHVRAGGQPPLPPDAAPALRGLTAACWRAAPEERPSAAELVAWLAAHPRALAPALAAPPAGPDLPAEPRHDQNLYFEEWTAE